METQSPKPAPVIIGGGIVGLCIAWHLARRGLKPLVKRYRKAQSRTLRGWYHRAVKGAESDLPQDRLLRAALLAGR